MPFLHCIHESIFHTLFFYTGYRRDVWETYAHISGKISGWLQELEQTAVVDKLDGLSGECGVVAE